MIKSMTGYGKASQETVDYNIQVEVKTLNSKNLDLFLKLPRAFSHQELTVRSMVTDALQRGKVSLFVEFNGAAANASSVNQPLLKAYYQAYLAAAQALDAPTHDLFRLAAQSPEVVQPQEQAEVEEETWQVVQQCVAEALAQCDAFRKQEGEALRQDLEERIRQIRQALATLQERLPERDAYVRQKLRNHLDEYAMKENVDESRFEQEMLYYLERLDINEEIVRLTSHLNYFQETMQEENSPGKKLGFIAQEIGREINTMGSKANDATIQHLVVRMKEELEKIKEQILNIV